MNSCERVHRAVTFKMPDRLPIYHQYLPGAVMRYGEELQKLFDRFPSDFGFNDRVAQEIPQEYQLGQYTDEWGCVWENAMPGIKGQVVVHPLADWARLPDYALPPALLPDVKSLNERIRRSGHTRYMRVGGWRFFEQLVFLRGFENVLIDLAGGSPELAKLADGLFHRTMAMVEAYCDTDVDCISFGDDWGAQGQLLISPRLWREFFKPYYQRMCATVKTAGKHVFFHSCGCIEEILDDLSEIGVDILNPQIGANNLQTLAAKAQGRLCILGGIDRQYVLPHGTVAEVRAHVRQVVAALGRNGGYIGAGEIGADVPWENAVAMYEAFQACRAEIYPTHTAGTAQTA